MNSCRNNFFKIFIAILILMLGFITVSCGTSKKNSSPKESNVTNESPRLGDTQQAFNKYYGVYYKDGEYYSFDKIQGYIIPSFNSNGIVKYDDFGIRVSFDGDNEASIIIVSGISSMQNAKILIDKFMPKDAKLVTTTETPDWSCFFYKSQTLSQKYGLENADYDFELTVYRNLDPVRYKIFFEWLPNVSNQHNNDNQGSNKPVEQSNTAKEIAVEAPSGKIGKGVVIDDDKDGLNVRDGAGTNFKVVTALPFGTVVNLNKLSDGWYYLSYKGVKGWASSKLITKIDLEGRKGHINAPDANIRSGPDKNSKLLGVFTQGEKLDVVGHVNGWYNVNRTNGQNCWVFDGYVSF